MRPPPRRFRIAPITRPSRLQAGLTLTRYPNSANYFMPVARFWAQPVGPRVPMALLLHRLTHKGPDPATLAESKRRTQLGEFITTRERLITDEARAAALTLNAQPRQCHAGPRPAPHLG